MRDMATTAKTRLPYSIRPPRSFVSAVRCASAYFHVNVRFLMVVSGALILGACTEQSISQSNEYDLVVSGGAVIDGSGEAVKRLDIFIRDGKIVHLGDASDLRFTTSKKIDATGLVVTPGFIDLHAHGNPLVQPLNNFLLQGVTTAALGQDGRSAHMEQNPKYDALRSWSGVETDGDPRRTAQTFAEWLDNVDDIGTVINVAGLTGHSTLRLEASIGPTSDVTETQLDDMISRLRKDLAAGSFGLSNGLEYVPGRYSSTDELVRLAEVVGEYDGIVLSHLRTEDSGVISGALDELIAQGRHARVGASHLKIVLGRDGSEADEVLAQIERARSEGVSITADAYPYLAGFSDLGLVYPSWAKSEEDWNRAVETRRDELAAYLRARIGQRNGPSAILIASGEYSGLTLDEVADRLNMNVEDVVIDIFGYGGPFAAHRIMDKDIQEKFLLSPLVAISTDGGPYLGHPRSWGPSPRVIRRYTVDDDAISLEGMVRKMTALPASVLGVKCRGLIKKGYAADLVVFDLETIRETATFENSSNPPLGIEFVIVNGGVAVKRSEITPGAYGRALRRDEEKCA